MYLKLEDPWSNFILSLIEATKKGEIKWKVLDPYTNLYSKNEFVKVMFLAEYEKKRVLLFEKTWEDKKLVLTNSNEVTLGKMFNTINNIEPKYEYETIKMSKIILLIPDPSLKTGWEIPFRNPLYDLISTVKYKLSGADDIFNSFSKKG